jgi:putative membrane protein
MPADRQKQFLDAQKSVEQTASVMEHLFRAPRPVVLAGPILLLSLLFGILIGFDPKDPYQTFVVNGILLLALPTYLAGILTGPLAESMGGKLYPRRSWLLSFLCLLIILGIIVVFWLFEVALDYKVSIAAVLVFGYSAVIWLRHLILLSTSNASHSKSLPASFVQPIIGYIMIFVFVPKTGFNEGTLALITLIIFLFSVILLTTLATAPMKKAFGVNGLTMLRYSLDHLTEGGGSGASEVEDFFDTFSEEMDVHVGVVAFRSKDKIKTIMVVPSVHPGPFGLLGGSDLPIKLSEGLKSQSQDVMVPHGSATHDLNLSRTREKDKIVRGVKGLLKDIQYSDSSSKFIRIHDGMDVCAQVFGNGILLVHTSSPNPTDDVDISTGSAIRDKASLASGKKALFIDAHNCAEKGSGCIYYGTPESHALISLSEKVSHHAKENMGEGIRAGYSQKTGYETERGIGRTGTQVLVMESGSQKSAYILFDGNNMEMGLREKIKKAVAGMVDEAEVLTTDNHAVNATIGGFNPVGLRMDSEGLVSDVKNLVISAIADLEEVQVGMSSGLVKKVRVFGHENVARLSSVVNSTMAIMKIATLISLLFAVSASAFVFALL